MKYRTTKGLFSFLSNKFKLQHNRFVMSLQYHKSHRECNASAKEWMGRQWTKAAECEYKEYYRLLTEQFIGRLNDEGMIDEIL